MPPSFLLSLYVFFIRGIVDYAEKHQNRQRDVHQSVNGFANVDADKFLYAKHDKSRDCKPERPAPKSVLCSSVHAFTSVVMYGL